MKFNSISLEVDSPNIIICAPKMIYPPKIEKNINNVPKIMSHFIMKDNLLVWEIALMTWTIIENPNNC